MTAQPIDDNTTTPTPNRTKPEKVGGQDEIPAELAAKIAKASLSIDSVPKRGRNDFHSYDYATADDVMEVARKALGEVGVAVFPSIGASVNPTAASRRCCA